MAALSLRGVRKNYGDVPVVHGIDLDIAEGEFAVFVGPSGCGKSTLLRMIAGLEEITGGDIAIGDRVVNRVPASDRGVAMVFQSYALYPHMTVAENMGFALKLAGQSKQAIAQAVGQAAEILQITPLLSRKPAALSGGQRQRVAIGRAIVRKPRVFLFDEPLSNLDAALRVQMRIELARLHRELGTTMVYVTHDQVEAMTLGDRIAVFNKGRIEQVGAPLSLYNAPANRFVAGFLGSPRMNFIDCGAETAQGGVTRLVVQGAGHLHWPGALPAGTQRVGGLQLGVRPEHLAITEHADGLAAQVNVVEHLGDAVIVHARMGHNATPVALRVAPQQTALLAQLQAGAQVRVMPQLDMAQLFDADGRALPRELATALPQAA
jgi:multiple sugar transport system ATP-binding protein